MQRTGHYNFGASGSIPTKHFPYDVPRERGHNVYNFWKAGPLKFGRTKKLPKFCAIFDNFGL